MKAQLMTFILAVSALAAGQASADVADVNLVKTSLNFDFNKEIEGNNLQKKSIQNNIDQSLAEIDAEEASDKSRVLDFVDLEVGFDSSPYNNNSIVDRRPNSLETPQVIEIKLLPAGSPDKI